MALEAGPQIMDTVLSQALNPFVAPPIAPQGGMPSQMPGGFPPGLLMALQALQQGGGMRTQEDGQRQAMPAPQQAMSAPQHPIAALLQQLAQTRFGRGMAQPMGNPMAAGVAPQSQGVAPVQPPVVDLRPPNQRPMGGGGGGGGDFGGWPKNNQPIGLPVGFGERRMDMNPPHMPVTGY